MFKAPFSFEGRIRRIEYFLSGLIAGIVGSIIWAIAFASAFVGIMSGSTAAAAGGSVFAILLGLAAYVAILWFAVAQGVKRLHDVDKSGWLYLLFLVPVVNFFFGLYLLFADGTVGPNQYGLDPKNRQPYQAPAATPVNVTVNISKEEVKTATVSSSEAYAPKAPVTEAPVDQEEKKEE